MLDGVTRPNLLARASSFREFLPGIRTTPPVGLRGDTPRDDPRGDTPLDDVGVANGDTPRVDEDPESFL